MLLAHVQTPVLLAFRHISLAAQSAPLRRSLELTFGQPETCPQPCKPGLLVMTNFYPQTFEHATKNLDYKLERAE